MIFSNERGASPISTKILETEPKTLLDTPPDLTDPVRALAEMQQARQAAEAATKAKDHFIATLSHELRTPLTPVLTTLQMMESENRFSAEDREALALCRRNVELEIRLIDDLLDLTRISRGKLALHKVPVDVHDILQRAIHICQSELQSNQLNLAVELNARQHHVRGDAARLQQILWNLLKNAIKFTPATGNITIRTENPTPDRLAVTVTDTGVGIKPSLLSRIFNAFEQGETATHRQFGGLGLGLSISKQIAELHGGTLSALSDGPNKGSTFTLKLNTCAKPKIIVSQPTLFQTQSPRKPGGRILLVEDHLDTSRTMMRLLKSLGYEVRVADTVASALQLASAEHFDALISDIGLPDGSGLDLMRQLSLKQCLKGIALSGFGMEDDVRKSHESGFIAHLTKPVDLERLEEVLRKLC